jgi:phospholipid/cholesterol/gamma-HCH transport system permease protein
MTTSLLKNPISKLGQILLETSTSIKDFYTLVLQTLVGVITPPVRWKDIFNQIYFMANQSMFIIVFCVSFAAMVTIVEASFHMKLVIHDDSMVPGFASLLILRELGSVVTALLLTSRVGAGLAAEIASMQITEQIDAFKMLGLEPIRFLVVPRFIASIFSSLALCIIANLVCIFCAMLVCTLQLGFTSGAFFTAMRSFVHFEDLVLAMIKGACFGAVIPLFSCYFGFRCRAGAEGVGLATTNSVVSTSIAIIIIDFLLTYSFSMLS